MPSLFPKFKAQFFRFIQFRITEIKRSQILKSIKIGNYLQRLFVVSSFLCHTAFRPVECVSQRCIYMSAQTFSGRQFGKQFIPYLQRLRFIACKFFDKSTIMFSPQNSFGRSQSGKTSFALLFILFAIESHVSPIGNSCFRLSPTHIGSLLVVRKQITHIPLSITGFGILRTLLCPSRTAKHSYTVAYLHYLSPPEFIFFRIEIDLYITIKSTEYQFEKIFCQFLVFFCVQSIFTHGQCFPPIFRI